MPSDSRFASLTGCMGKNGGISRAAAPLRVCQSHTSSRSNGRTWLAVKLIDNPIWLDTCCYSSIDMYERLAVEQPPSAGLEQGFFAEFVRKSRPKSGIAEVVIMIGYLGGKNLLISKNQFLRALLTHKQTRRPCRSGNKGGSV